MANTIVRGRIPLWIIGSVTGILLIGFVLGLLFSRLMRKRKKKRKRD
jgi:succinate dehydrogenase hydrophobic anchor subunit|uniref:PsbJ n=1 Tax=Drosera rotundifolia TaxID=173423 RepID=A0A140E9T5_DRORT|nr:psbJ [Drosera rotundifolia]YP_009241310.1 psbJ [Drosera rotundifolia]AMK97298.1 PsbJ [Drosera rotundifolia]AMK97320.1 PsbJ [Drosera rotundifolia]